MREQKGKSKGEKAPFEHFLHENWRGAKESKRKKLAEEREYSKDRSKDKQYEFQGTL